MQPRQRLALPLVAISALAMSWSQRLTARCRWLQVGSTAGKLINSARQSRASARKPHAARGNHLPEAGFFITSHRRKAATTTRSSRICSCIFQSLWMSGQGTAAGYRKPPPNPQKSADDIEANAVNVFREVRDAITMAINADNPALMSQPRLLDRLTHAHAYMALHADPASLAG